MNTETNLQASIANLRELLRKVSLIQASQYFNELPFQLIASLPDQKPGQVLAHFVATVLLTSAELSIAFKVHFNPDQIRSYRQATGCRAEDLSDKELINYMKELSNQMGGRVCRVFEAHRISLGMSVPLCTRGIYEIYADYQDKTGSVTKFADCWRLDASFGAIYCTCHVEFNGQDNFSAIKAEDEASDEGELEFL